MNPDLSHFSKMLDAVYGTALDDGRWTDLFGAMQKTVGLEHFVVQGFDNKLETSVIADLYGYDESFAQSYESHYWKLNPWLPGIGSAPIGKAVGAETYYPEEGLRKTEFYNDFIRRQDDVGTGGSVIVFRDEHRFLSVGGNIKFSQRDNMLANWLGLLDLLSPHLRNAFELRRQLAGSQLKDATFLTALDAIGNAVFLLNAKGQVSYSNPAAQRLMKAGTLVFQDSSGVLRTYDSRAGQAISKQLYEIALNLAPTDPKQLVLHAHAGFGNAFATLAPFTPDPGNIDKFAAFATEDVPVAIMTVTDPGQRKNHLGSCWQRFTG